MAYTEKVGKYIIREQSLEEIQSAVELPFTLCGLNPYGHFQNIRRFVADLDGKTVGDGWTLTSRYNPWGRLGHFGIVSDEHKRKGLGSRLLKRCIEAVREAGMEAMFIDTGPGIAHVVYEKHGFRDVVPDHPEWVGLSYDERTIQDHLTDYFDIDQEPLEVRTLDFSHLTEIQVLLNASVDPDILVKNYLLTLFADDQIHEGQILVEIPALSASKREERKIRMLGLFAENKLIGFSTLAPWRTTRWDNRHEAHIGLVDLYLHATLWRRCTPLLEEILRSAREMGFSCLRTMDTPRETVKTDVLLTLGFRVKFEMHGEVVLGEGTPERGVYPNRRLENLAVYEIEFGEPGGYTHPYRIPWDC